MSNDDDYVYDDESGEWIPASEMRIKQADAGKAAEVVVRDSVGNVLADGDQVIGPPGSNGTTTRTGLAG